MTSLRMTICTRCRHLINSEGAPRCAAYPAGIPEKYATGRVQHIDPDGDDNGIQFQPRPMIDWPVKAL